MKRIALLLAILLTTQSCATWWENFKKDPVAQIERAVSSVSAVISLATMLFGQIKPNLHADSQADAQKKFDDAVLACVRGQLALKKAVDAAKEAQEPNPDFTKIMADIGDSVRKLQELVNGLKAQMAPRGLNGRLGAVPLTGEAEFKAAVEVVVR